MHHGKRAWLVTTETDLAKKAVQKETDRKAALAAEVDDTGSELIADEVDNTDSEITEDEEENSSTTELAKAIGLHASADEVRKLFKEKHPNCN